VVGQAFEDLIDGGTSQSRFLGCAIDQIEDRVGLMGSQNSPFADLLTSFTLESLQGGHVQLNAIAKDNTGIWPRVFNLDDAEIT